MSRYSVRSEISSSLANVAAVTGRLLPRSTCNKVSKRLVRDTVGRLFPEKSSELSRGCCQKLAGVITTASVPEVLRELPKALHNIFESPVGALCAIVLNIFLPEEFIELEEDEFDPQASVLQVIQNPDVADKGEPASPAAVAQLNRA